MTLVIVGYFLIGLIASYIIYRIDGKELEIAVTAFIFWPIMLVFIGIPVGFIKLIECGRARKNG